MSADKCCSKCGRWLPLDQFRKSGSGNHRPECKACSKFIEQTRVPSLPETRICKICGVEKPIAEFGKVAGGYARHQCNPCERARGLARYYRTVTPEKNRQRGNREKRRRLQRLMAVRS